MEQYKKLITEVLNNGIKSDDRTGTGTLSVFGSQSRYDLSKGFPIVTTKKTFWKGVLVELLWLMRGDTNIKFLKDRNVNIWNEWADEKGELGPVYGKMWRSFGETGIDQLGNAINMIRNNGNSRRIIVTAWNPEQIDNMALPPCHMMYQFYVRNGKLSCQLYQRSADLFLGVPFNIASYACLTHLIANECKLEVGEFIHTIGDLHLYNNHLGEAVEVLNREPMKLPELEINMNEGCLMNWVDNICHRMSWSDISDIVKLKGYKSHPAIKAEVSV